MTESADLQAAVARLRASKRALFVSHMNPDGDAIGSELALAELARALGVEVMIVNHDPVAGDSTAAPAEGSKNPNMRASVCCAELIHTRPAGSIAMAVTGRPSIAPSSR